MCVTDWGIQHLCLAWTPCFRMYIEPLELSGFVDTYQWTMQWCHQAMQFNVMAIMHKHNAMFIVAPIVLLHVTHDIHVFLFYLADKSLFNFCIEGYVITAVSVFLLHFAKKIKVWDLHLWNEMCWSNFKIWFCHLKKKKVYINGSIWEHLDFNKQLQCNVKNCDRLIY